MEAYLIDVQRGSVHDGPGLRTTVFLKGCPLRCKWCHNPESQLPKPQLSVNERRCSGCKLCENVCKNHVHKIVKEETKILHKTKFEACVLCNSCVEKCPNHAIKLIGQLWDLPSLLELILKDQQFFEQTDGGVTVSGGEPLAQAEFVAALLQLCQEEGIHTCVETSGFGTKDAIKLFLPVTDLFYFDWKVSTEEVAKEYIGVSLKPIRDNLDYMLKHGANVVLRCPIIPGVNDNKEHFQQICDLIKEYPQIMEAQLLPYHSFGVTKSKNIGQIGKSFSVPTKEEKEEWMTWFSYQEENIAKRIVWG